MQHGVGLFRVDLVAAVPCFEVGRMVRFQHVLISLDGRFSFIPSHQKSFKTIPKCFFTDSLQVWNKSCNIATDFKMIVRMKTLFKFHIIQLGCQSNEADAFGIISCLLAHGCSITDSIEDSDVIIVMTCGFASKRYNNSIDCIKKVNRIKRSDAEIWIGGCIPAINANLAKELPFEVGLVFAPRDFEQKIEEYLDCHLDFSKINSNDETIESVPVRIINGCSENCTYCVIKCAGGTSRSKPMGQIINLILALNRNVKTIKLVGEEVGAYGKDLGVSLLDLVQRILDIRPDVTISFSAIHPKYFIQDYEMYVELFNIKNISRILPIPVQSGSNSVLKAMNRGYTIENVMGSVKSFLKVHPDVEISTDIMVGFPTESWDDFLLSKSLVEELPLAALECFKYDDMKGVGDCVDESEKKKRLEIIALTFIRRFCIEHNITNLTALDDFIKGNKIPINVNI